MKNPNGYGSVVKLSGNRRRPYIIKKTIGWNEKGHPISLIIGYAKTKEEGMIALAEYNKDPYDVKQSKMTLQSIFELFKDKKFIKLSVANQNVLSSAFIHTKKYWKTEYKLLKSYHMQDVIDNCGRGASVQQHIKSLFTHLDKFALELDIINKSYAQLVTTDPTPETNKIPFTDTEIEELWRKKDQYFVDTVLILLYSGFRIGELLNLKLEDVDLEERTFKGGSKTAFGKNRIVPIHSLIYDLVVQRFNNSYKYLIELNRSKLKHNDYYKIWDEIMSNFEVKHTPHECRHTFRSKLDSAGANKSAIDMLMGHKSSGVGERIYTHKTINELREAIELVTR